ncbi:SCO2521 family protein [Nocardia aurea]|uniref:SCO2521 family protein n=1 Tax=Nocardia aurea TaxID=2144174 RepID=A0ABV3FU34_9NOCA
MAVFGEVCTALLPTTEALRRGEVEELLELNPDSRMQWRERPLSLGISPSTLHGVDCQLVAPAHPTIHAIGTVATRAVVVGGRVVQSSAHCVVVRSAFDKRQGWAHYLNRAGVLEVVTRIGSETTKRMAEGFLGTTGKGALDLTTYTDGLLGDIGMRRLGRAPLRTGTTRLRWAARVGEVDAPQVAFRLQDDILRTVLVVVPSGEELSAAQRFCEDLAVHDWLLTAVTDAVERADLAGPGAAAADIIGPVLHHLAHLWVPGAHTPPELRGLWGQLREEPDFTAGWRATIDHLRNRMLLSIWNTLRHNRIGNEV